MAVSPAAPTGAGEPGAPPLARATVIALSAYFVVVWGAHAGTRTLASVLVVVWALLCVTGGTLYQRQFCAGSDLRAAVCIHFAATALLMLPLGVACEGFAIAWNEPIALALGYHVVLGSIGAFSILHLLMRHGQATGVTSLLYLTPPVAAIVEWAVYGVAPTPA